MTNCLGNSALHFAVEYQYKKVAEYLIQKGANKSIQNVSGFKATEGLHG